MRVRSDIWNQFSGNPAGSGFRLVNTVGANALRWQSDLQADTGTSSPVFGPDGTIYIGTVKGRLVAIEPAHGSIKWTVEIAGRDDLAVQTPAVADDGTIYCLCTTLAEVRDHRTGPLARGIPSFIIAVGADGTVRWRMQIRSVPDLFGSVNCTLFGAPRVLSGPGGVARIFFVLRYSPIVQYPEVDKSATGPSFARVLAIVDQTGKFLLFNRYEDKKLFIDAHGGGGGFGSATIGGPPDGGLPKEAHPCLDTPVVFGSFPATDPFTIIAPGEDGLYAVRYSDRDGALTGTPKLFPLASPFPAPVAFPNGLMTGTTGSAATFIDSDTFTKYVPNATEFGGPTTVAGGLRQMYFVVRSGTLIAVDSNGTVWKQRGLEHGSVAFPALSANHVHVATTGGLRTFTLDLQDVASITLGGAGISSPAIGPGGEVYATQHSTLFSFFDVAARTAPNVRDHRKNPPTKPSKPAPREA